MLDTTLKLIEIVSLGTASACVIHLMVAQVRLKRFKKRQAELAKAKDEAYTQGQKDLLERQVRDAEAWKEARQKKGQWHAIEEEKAFRTSQVGNVIQMPMR